MFWTWKWRLEWVLAAVGAGGCLLLAMVVTCVMVFGRYVLQADLLPGAYNYIERILFPLMVFWAMPIAHREGMFPRLETLSDRLSPRGAVGLSALCLAVELAVYGALFWFVAKFAWGAFATARPMQIGTAFWPMWPVLAMIPLSIGLMVIEMARLLWRDIARLRQRLR